MQNLVIVCGLFALLLANVESRGVHAKQVTHKSLFSSFMNTELHSLKPAARSEAVGKLFVEFLLKSF